MRSLLTIAFSACMATTAQAQGQLERVHGRIVVEVSGDDDGVQVTVDGLVLPRHRWGVPTRVELGEHLIEARRDGEVVSSSRAVVPRGGDVHVELVVATPRAEAGAGIRIERAPRPSALAGDEPDRESERGRPREEPPPRGEAPSTTGAREDSRERARELFGEGVEASGRSDWETAAAKFELALQAHSAPTIEYNLSLTYLELGRLGEAGDLTASVLANPESSDDLRGRAEELDSDIAERAGTLTIEVEGEANEGAIVAVDGRELAPERVGVPRHETPGSRTITLTREDGSVENQTVTVSRGSPARVSFGPPLVGSDDEDGGVLTDPVFWAVAGGSVLLSVIIVAVAVAASGGSEVGGDYDPPVLRFP